MTQESVQNERTMDDAWMLLLLLLLHAEEEIAIFKRFAELPPDVGKWASGHLLPPDVSCPFRKSQS